MREIIFRGKSIDENNKGEWKFGFYRHFVMDKYNNHYIDSIGQNVTTAIDINTLGEYIHLKDKKNDSVFSGDIVKFGTQQYEIKWNDEQCCFGFWTGNAWQSGCNKDTIAMAEIIGNIHDKD